MVLRCFCVDFPQRLGGAELEGCEGGAARAANAVKNVARHTKLRHAVVVMHHVAVAGSCHDGGIVHYVPPKPMVDERVAHVVPNVSRKRARNEQAPLAGGDGNGAKKCPAGEGNGGRDYGGHHNSPKVKREFVMNSV